MKNFSKKSPGISLVVGSLMAVITMIMHPLGGDMAHIVKISRVLVFSHSLAIACLPLIVFGLWGWCSLLVTPSRVAVLGFIIASFGLCAAALAGIINGLVLPKFASHFVASDIDKYVPYTVLNYARVLNQSLAYVFMAAISIAIFIWSILLIGKRLYAKWFGCYGIVVAATGIFALLFTSDMTSVFFFGAFVFGISSWLIGAGLLLMRLQKFE